MGEPHQSATTIGTALNEAADLLGSGSETARLDAEVLLAAVLDMTRTALRAWPDRFLSPRDLEAYRALTAQRARGVPVAYLTGCREFWSLPLIVTPDTLIPRPETELLVELALARIPHNQSATVADLGTGSGAIALAIASERPHCRIVATDCSAAALAVARANAERLRTGNIEWLAGCWFEPLDGRRFDVIVSNPPYVADADPHLERGDLRFEPRIALTSGGNGLDDLRSIAEGARRHLKPGGWLLLEHGHDQSGTVTRLLNGFGYTSIEAARDLAGVPRAVAARNSP